MKELNVITNLIIALRGIPGIGNKSAERIAYELIKMNDSKLENIINSLNDIHKINICPICGSYMDLDNCPICNDSTRDKEIILVVGSFKDVLALERITSLHVSYHILNGSISPSKGITASDINIKKLLERLSEGNVKEVILATNPTIDGETTALYISRLLEQFPNIKVTRLASGLPMGANLDYADELTLTRALEGRTIYGNKR